MLERCYGNSDLSIKYYSDKGVFVCQEWHNFQNFAEWFYSNAPKDIENFDLDKDITFDGNKMYSPETCKFASRSDNSSKAFSKKYTMIDPSGNIVHIENMKRFCKENNIKYKSMIRIANGKGARNCDWKLFNIKCDSK